MGILSITLYDRPEMSLSSINKTPIRKKPSMQKESKEETAYKKDFYNDKLSVKGEQYGCVEDLECQESNDPD